MRKTATMAHGLLAGCVLFAASIFSASAQAGVALGATRVIYPAGQKQVQLAVTNNDDNSTWLIQSWVENADGQRDGRFVITLLRCLPCRVKREHLRIIDATNNQLPQDRESLFWMNVKAIPSMDKSKLSDNTPAAGDYQPHQASTTVRGKLALPPDQAAEKLTFSRSGSSLTLTNPTPYYLTVTELNAGTRILENALVPPMGKTSVKLPADAGNTITYRTINDYGALTL